MESVQAQRELVALMRSWVVLEALARGLRWIDEVAESERTFHDAAVDLIERVEQAGDGDAYSRARTAGFLVLAGEPDSAREWGVRAADTWERAGDSVEHDGAATVDTLLIVGERERAVALARAHGLRSRGLELLEAEADGDAQRCEALIATLVADLRADRSVPVDGSGESPVDTWDWLELAHLARARIVSEPAPTYTEMLSRSGVLEAAPRERRTVRIVGGDVERFSVAGADGVTVEAVVDRRDPACVEVRLEPRTAGYLAIRFLWTDGRGYHARLRTTPQGGDDHVFNAESPDVREVVGAAVDWLAAGELRVRDGPWAARTLRDVAARLPLS